MGSRPTRFLSLVSNSVSNPVLNLVLNSDLYPILNSDLNPFANPVSGLESSRLSTSNTCRSAQKMGFYGNLCRLKS